jgi:hypothetical protein
MGKAKVWHTPCFLYGSGYGYLCREYSCGCIQSSKLFYFTLLSFCSSFFSLGFDAIGNNFPTIDCHYFWPRLIIALPKNTLPIFCKDTGILFHYWCCKIQNEEEISKTDPEPAKKTQFIYIGFLTLANCCCCSCKKRKKKKNPKTHEARKKIYQLCL